METKYGTIGFIFFGLYWKYWAQRINFVKLDNLYCKEQSEWNNNNKKRVDNLLSFSEFSSTFMGPRASWLTAVMTMIIMSVRDLWRWCYCEICIHSEVIYTFIGSYLVTIKASDSNLRILLSQVEVWSRKKRNWIKSINCSLSGRGPLTGSIVLDPELFTSV